jgi:hypothetical protein
LTCEYLREFSEKFETVLMGYSGAGGKLINEKPQAKNLVTLQCDLLVSFSLCILLEPLGIVTKVEKEGEEEEKEEKERKKGEEEEGKERMSYPGDPMLEDESLQYRVQGTFSQHRYTSSYLLYTVTKAFW